MKKINIPVFCDVVIFDPLGRIILIADGVMKYGDPDPNIWCNWKIPRYVLPGKGLPAKNIKENITAETGIVVKPMSPVPVGIYTTHYFDEPNKSNGLHLVYLAEFAEHDVRPNQKYSTGFTVEQVLDLQLKNKIVDSDITVRIIMDAVSNMLQGNQFQFGSVEIPPPFIEGECKVIE